MVVVAVVVLVVALGMGHERRGRTSPSAAKRSANPDFKGKRDEVAIQDNRCKVAKIVADRLNLQNQQ